MKGNANDYNIKITNAFAEVFLLIYIFFYSNYNWINTLVIDQN